MSDETEIALINQKLGDLVDRHGVTDEKIDKIFIVLNKVALQQQDIKNIKKEIAILFQQREKDFGEGGVVEKLKSRQAKCPVKENSELATKKEIDDLWVMVKWIGGVSGASIVLLATLIFAILNMILKGSPQ